MELVAAGCLGLAGLMRVGEVQALHVDDVAIYPARVELFVRDAKGDRFGSGPRIVIRDHVEMWRPVGRLIERRSGHFQKLFVFSTRHEWTECIRASFPGSRRYVFHSLRHRGAYWRMAAEECTWGRLMAWADGRPRPRRRFTVPSHLSETPVCMWVVDDWCSELGLGQASLIDLVLRTRSMITF